MQKKVIGKPEDNVIRYCEQLNEELRKNNRLPFHRENIIDKILLYEVDGGSVEDNIGKNKYLNRAIASIQNTMTDDEQYYVANMCANNELNDKTWLIKDGSIQYNQGFSFIKDKSQWLKLRTNYQHVIGVSKLFDPELLPDLSIVIANLRPFERTKVYEYQSNSKKESYSTEKSWFAVWYIRIRADKYQIRESQFSDVVKCELLLPKQGAKISTELVDFLSASIIREAYPVCYGADSRWANHLYPVYLTEKFCKSHYLDSSIIYNLF